ncbi:hypothetical protein [Comamonas testosteroni]|uniref:hypothetical protein n=1 Tax=Comamonas testosteroni TaxID=285 RepID=UPI000A660507|nr:hypothetical protein [Comamonas testosteroni]
MLKFILSPQARNDSLAVSVAADVLTLNGVALDFTRLPDGATLPCEAIDCQWIAGDVQRVDGVLQVPLLLPIASDASDAARFPEPITVTQDGPVELPQ